MWSRHGWQRICESRRRAALRSARAGCRRRAPGSHAAASVYSALAYHGHESSATGRHITLPGVVPAGRRICLAADAPRRKAKLPQRNRCRRARRKTERAWYVLRWLSARRRCYWPGLLVAVRCYLNAATRKSWVVALLRLGVAANHGSGSDRVVHARQP